MNFIKFAVILLSICGSSSRDIRQLQQLERHNFLIGIARVGQLLEPQTTCGQELSALLSAILAGKLWSVKVIDNFGVVPSSFAWGNYFWFESPDLCHELNQPYTIRFSQSHKPPVQLNATSPMAMRFSVLYMNFTRTAPRHYADLKLPFERYISLGLCLPAACNLTALVHFADVFFARNVFEMQRNFALQLRTVESKQPGFSLQIFGQPSSLIFITLGLLLMLLNLWAELLPRVAANANGHRLTKLLLCFRLSDNCRLLLQADAKGGDGYVAAIAGLRCIVCLWVSIFHVYYYSLYAISNATLLFAKLEYFVLQPITQACFYVDLFFTISALLLVYQFLQNTPQLQQIENNRPLANIKLFAKALARRYLRLTPVLVLIMLLADIWHNALNALTPFRLGQHNGIYCKITWWHNLLYMQNWLNLDDICCSWTWYLACEMQFHALCLGLLYVTAGAPFRRVQLAKWAFAALLLLFIPLAWLSSIHNQLSFHIDSIYSTLNQLYAKPWARIIPYLGGLFAGWLLHTQRQTALNRQQQQQQATQWTWAWRWANTLPWRCIFWLWVCSVFLGTSFMSYWRDTSIQAVAAIMSLGKLLFALTAGLVIVLCSSGQGGPLRALLCARLWRAINKFCFSIYMLAPIMIFASFGLRPKATKFSELGSFNDCVALLLLAFIAALLSWLLVELPVQRLTQLLLPP